MALISDEFIERLLADVNIVTVIQKYCPDLKRKGAYYFCKSPFTKENTPSFCVREQTQTFKDFSSGKGGNVITFVMEHQGLSYPEAINLLAEFANKEVEYDTQEVSKAYIEKKERVKKLEPFLVAIQKKFVENLHALDKEHPAWQEIKRRGYNDETVNDWEIGYAPGNKFIYNLFKEAGAVDAGKKLGLINDNNQDKLWNRITYPIHDKLGKIVGFASRDLSGESNSAKWMNPAENEIYNKSSILFAHHRAAKMIAQTGKAWIVEGYNDVIAWHNANLFNTVSCCGTAITDAQINVLKKNGAEKIVLCMDADKAGKAATLKAIPQLLRAGLTVEICQLPGVDPDDFFRTYQSEIQEHGLEEVLPPLKNGFKLYMEDQLQGDELDRAKGVRKITETIAQITDLSLRDIYMDWLIKESKSKPATVKLLLTEHQSKNLAKSQTGDEMYLMPKGTAQLLEELKPIINKYQLFIANNQIYIQDTFEPPYRFKSISNFSIEILQHMSEDKFPIKLISVTNVKGESRVFDAPASCMTAPLEFTKILANQGNYKFKGNRNDLDKLTDYLYDEMGVGRKVDVLGWNPEGFYCTNNTVIVPGEPNLPIDSNGIFRHKGTTYYVPSANEIYRANPYKFQTQKKIVISSATVPMHQYLAQMLTVHREYAIIGMLFAFAAAHQDLIIQYTTGFPVLFLYGPPSTGKDQLFSCIKRMFGLSETDFISLENRQSTGKAKIRVFAELANMVVHLSEFTNGNQEVDGLIKGLWDRGGYKFGTLDSNVSTDTVPILSAALMTGNEAPTNDAVLTRILYGEMDKNQFTDQEKEEFSKLNEMTRTGITEYIQRVVWHRPLFVKHFGDKYKMYRNKLAEYPEFDGVIDRILTNFSILGATYEVLRDTNDIIFPFEFQTMVDTFRKWTKNLRAKLDSANIFAKFWDIFIAVMRGNAQMQIRVGRDLKLDGSILYFNFTNVYNRIQIEWQQRFNEPIPAKTELLKQFREQSFYKDYISSIRMSGEATAPKTSAVMVDINLTGVKDEILYAVQWQINETGLFPVQGTDSPATPDNTHESKSTKDDLPF